MGVWNHKLPFRAIFTNDATIAAQRLLGCTLSHGSCAGLITEAEAYRAVGDPACERFYNARRQAFAANHPAGTIHLHTTYGRYIMLNVLTKDESGIGFVLIRSLQPVSGLATMRTRRATDTDRLLCNGPGKLTQALEIEAANHKRSIYEILIDRNLSTDPLYQARPRIGISTGTDSLWRYTLV